MKRRPAASDSNSSNSDTRRSGRSPARLSSKLEHRLESYATAARGGGAHNHRLMGYVGAAAVGVGLLGRAPVAEADIVYTPVNIGIPNQPAPHPGVVSIPFASDAVVFAGFFEGCPECPPGHIATARWVSVRPYGNLDLDLGLSRGYQIGSQARFGAGGTITGWSRACGPSVNGGWYCNSFGGGPWSGYLGVRFWMYGQRSPHYGWVALSLSQGGGTVTGFAYETLAGHPIDAGQTFDTPEPGTLGLLALGSLGLGYWRRKKQESRE